MGGYDYAILSGKVNYAAIQLGMYLLDEHQENLKTLDRGERQLFEYRSSMQGIYEQETIQFKCFFGVLLDPNSLYLRFDQNPFRENEGQMEEFRDMYAELFRKYYDYQPCPFHLTYQRMIPEDQASPFKLISYDMTHTHPLGFHLYRFKDLLHFAEPRYNQHDNFYYPHAHWRNLWSRNRQHEKHQGQPEATKRDRTVRLSPFKIEYLDKFKASEDII